MKINNTMRSSKGAIKFVIGAELFFLHLVSHYKNKKYSCSARLMYFEISFFKEISRAEHEFMNIHPHPRN